MSSEQFPIEKAEWVVRYEKRLTDAGLDKHLAEYLSAHELEEFGDGNCDCLNESPEDVADDEISAWCASV